MVKILDYIKANWEKLLIIVIVIWLLFILFGGCKRERELVEQHRIDKALIDKSDKKLKELEAKFAIDSAEHEEYLLQYDSLIRYLSAELDKKQGTVNTYFTRIKKLQQSATDVKTDADTTEYVKRMDSAAYEFDQLAAKYSDLEKNMDALISAQASKDSTNAAYIELLKNQLTIVRNAYLEVLDKYNILYKDFTKVSRKSKNRQLLNKILAGGILGLGGAYLLK